MLLSSSSSMPRVVFICSRNKLCTGTSIALFYCTVVRSEHIALASEIE